MGGRGTALAVAALVAAASAVVSAQPAEPADVPVARDPRVAKRWLVVGQQAVQRASYFAARNRPHDAKQHLESAIAAFAKAIEAGDDVAIYLELAAAEEKLGRLDDAVRHVRRVVDAGGAVRLDIAKRARARLDELLTRVGLVTLTVVPPGTSITLGGTELGTSPLREPLVLLPGTYTLSFQADGFQPREAELKVEPGSETERTVELERVKVVVEPVQPVVEEVAPVFRPPPRSRTPLYIGAGVAGAALVSVGVFGVLAVGQHSTFAGASTSRSDREDARTSGQRFALIADVSLAAAAVAAGVTVYWYIYRYRQHPGSRANNPAKLDAVPWVQPESGGVALAGRF